MLKQYLSLLLSKFYSKKENEAVGHQAMPSNEKIDIAAHPAEIDGWTNFATYTTPTDGYVSIRAEAYKSTAAIQISTGSEDKMPSIFTAANNPGEWLQTVIPVSKGVSVRLQGGGIKNAEGFFSKTIGGGYQALKNALLEGGVLCRLKHLCNSLQRSSWIVKRSGCSKTLSSLKETQLQSLIKDLALHLLRTLLLQTDCLEFGIKQVKGIALHCLAIATVTEVTQQDGNFLRPTDGQLKTHFMYLREKSSNLIQTAIRQALPECGSIRRINLTAGGASC